MDYKKPMNGLKNNKMRRFKKCIVTGATGSGGSYLVEHILEKKKSIKLNLMLFFILHLTLMLEILLMIQ